MIISVVAALALAAEPPALRPGLEPLAFLVGHCWQGTFEPSGERDTHCFETVYDGQHVRDRHEVTGGSAAYSGETFYSAEGDRRSRLHLFQLAGRGQPRHDARPPGRLDFGDEQLSRRRRPRDHDVDILAPRRGRFLRGGHQLGRRAGDEPDRGLSAPGAGSRHLRKPRGRRNPHPGPRDSDRGAGRRSLVGDLDRGGLAQLGGADRLGAGAEPDIIETSYSPSAVPGGPETIRQRILAAVPGRMMAFRTVKAPEGFPNFDVFRRTTGLFELEPEGDGRTRVRLTGAGYPDDEAGRQLITFFREGNRISLERLRQRFATGPIDWSRQTGAAAEGGE